MTAIPACHGIALAPEELGLELGWLDQPPPLGVQIEQVDHLERTADAELVWQLNEPAALGLPAITSQTWVESGDCVVVANTLNLALRVDHRRQSVSVAAKNGNRQVVLEALASIALPLVAQRAGSLVLHGAAAALDGRAVLICAQGGSGKSSMLAGLAALGWEALSEDQCTVGIDGSGAHLIWPGPSWVRMKHGAPPPPLVAARPPRFEAADKVAWDIRDWIAHAPAQLERIVLLDPPGGHALTWEPVNEEDVIASVARRATWLLDEAAFAAAVLPQVVELAMSVPGFRMQVPRRPDWLDRAVAAITEA